MHQNRYHNHNSGQSNPSHKRRRENDSYEQPPPRLSTFSQKVVRLRRDIVEIGEPSRLKLSDAIRKLGDSLGAVDTGDIRNALLGTIIAVVIEQPHKIPLLAGAIQIANSQSEIFGQVIVELTQSKIQEALDNGELSHLKLILRFAVCLSPIIDGYGVVDLLRTLLNRASELQKSSPSKKSLVAEDIYIAVLLALPYYIVSCSPSSERYNETLKITSDLLNESREQFEIVESKATELLKPFKEHTTTNNKYNVPYDQREFVVLVREALDNVHPVDSPIDQWQISKLLDVPALIKDYIKKEKEITNDNSEQEPSSESYLKRHLFAAVNVPAFEVFKNFQSHKYPNVYLQVYLPSLFQTVPSPNSYEGVLLRDIATDIMAGMDFNRKEVTRQLITLDLFFSDAAFAEPGISFDRLEKITDGKSTWKVEDVALEAILQHIFNLPEPPHYSSYYHAILIEACIMAPQAIAPVFGRAIRFIYNNLETLDIELIFRFLDWFAQHLSNFSFTWKWKEWNNDLNLVDTHPKRVFIQQLIEKELRLSYPERLRDTLPEEFQKLLRQIPGEPVFKYYEPDSHYESEVRQLVTVLREKLPNNGDDVQKAVKSLREKALAESVGGHAAELDKTLVDVLVTTVCYLGNRSLSHSKTWVSQTADILKEFIHTHEDERNVVETVVTYWLDQPHVGKWVMRYFVEENIISDWVVVEYLLTSPPSELPPAVSSDGWEQLLWVLGKYYGPGQRVDHVGDIINIISKSLDEYENGSDETSEWVYWWYKGILRSLIRKYPVSFDEVRQKQEHDNLNAYIVEAFSELKELIVFVADDNEESEKRSDDVEISQSKEPGSEDN